MVVWHAQPVLYEFKIKEMYKHVAYKCQFSRGTCDKVMYMFLVSILYLVYSEVVVDLLLRVESCIMYVRVGKTCD